MTSAFPSLLTSSAPKATRPSLLSGYFHNQVQFHFPPFASIFSIGLSNLRLPLSCRGFPFPLPNTDPASPRGSPRGRMRSAHESTPRPTVCLAQHCPRAQGGWGLEPGKGQWGQEDQRSLPATRAPYIGSPLFRSAHFCPLLNYQKLAKKVMSGEKDKVSCLRVKKTKP